MIAPLEEDTTSTSNLNLKQKYKPVLSTPNNNKAPFPGIL